jgi:nucleotide-binding universal stress UspA family protein
MVTTRLRRLLHPTDFSAASRAALDKAIALARAHRGQLLIAHVLPPVALMPASYGLGSTYDGLFRARRATGLRQLDRLVARARAAGVRASGVLVDVGLAHEEIARLARARRVDTIVMGTHGRTGVTRALLGSVASQVVASAPCPVLTVKVGAAHRRTGRVQRVMCATDFSAASRAAFRAAVTLARAARATLVVAHVLRPVVEPLVEDGLVLSSRTWDQLASSVRVAADEQLARDVARARAAGVRATGIVREGPVVGAIVRATKTARADILVVGTHGRTGVSRLVLGSVAAPLLAMSPCPVLTVRSAASRRRPAKRTLPRRVRRSRPAVAA